MNVVIVLRVKRLRKALYGIGTSTMRKFMSMLLELSLPPTLTGNFFVPRG